MKEGDLIKFDGYVSRVVCIDLEDDIWFEIESSDYQKKGHTCIKECSDGGNGYFDEDYIEYFNKDLCYDFLARFDINFIKINLTKLARKMYNIPEDFTGDFYKVTEV